VVCSHCSDLLKKVINARQEWETALDLGDDRCLPEILFGLDRAIAILQGEIYGEDTRDSVHKE
jgi:hypothetical protein